MARVRDLPKATTASAGDYLLIDGPSGTRAIQATSLSGSSNTGGNRAFSWTDLIRPGGLTQRNSVVRMENKGTFDTRAVQVLNNHTYSDLFLGDYWDLPGVGKIVVGGFGIAPGVSSDHVILVVIPYSNLTATSQNPANEAIRVGQRITNDPNLRGLRTKQSTIRRPNGVVCTNAPFFPLTLAEIGYPSPLEENVTHIPLPGVACHSPSNITTASVIDSKLVSIGADRVLNTTTLQPVITGIIVG
nr:MAG TPA: hypothetical protein [Caudoviricetes sp.]